MIGTILVKVADCYSLLIIINVCMSWIPHRGEGALEDIRSFLGKLCDPYLNLFKRLIPPIGGVLDITPIIALIVLSLGVSIIARFI
ncbi:MAG: YggT family protein [Eggerthellaceae bacterium]|jgi:YggT family protein|nr:YggT family protein [Eggerthellaceae bacterium]